ncbi:amino acid adenylation domain-containing protein [Streptomyces canus]|uniref:amino acid adenylation domain-containing protein n=1 Tax=Streptomyces canus TaxID=58343 RepID=UPI0036840B47
MRDPGTSPQYRSVVPEGDGLMVPARVDSWVAARIAAHPDAIAVEDRGLRISYAELGRTAAQVAALLETAGRPPGGLVGIRMRRSWKMYAALLGIWMHGSGYVPVDPTYPQERQDYIIEDAGLALLVEDGPPGDDFALSEPARRGAEPTGLPDDTAYVLYTSGSTGHPKGVVLRHSSVVALLQALIAEYAFDEREVWAQFTSQCFDISVAETWTPLVTGARLIVVPEETAADPGVFAGLLADGAASVLSQVPTVFRYLLNSLETTGRRLPSIRHVLLCGEPVEPATVIRWYDVEVAPRAAVHNLYGPTEATVYATCQELTRQALTTLDEGTPIGRAMRHVETLILKEDAPAPTGEAGEILLGGASLAWGYLGMPGHTAERFVTRPDGRWYRTGDYAREADGGLRYLGREDGQIKLRGLRIELGEIEARLNALDEVLDAAVALTRFEGGDPFLAACYVPAEGASGPVAWAKIRSRLADALPSYMIPMRFIEVDKLPQTLNGKLDRRRLELTIAAELTS